MTRQEIQLRLAEPFAPEEIDWKPQVVKENRAMAIAYIDARTVMDRLDAVLGVGNWHTAYQLVEGGVVCTLSVRIEGDWSDHADVGSYSDQKDRGDALKAAFSDALKRAAVHLGVGRYLYRLESSWVDYDPKTKAITKPPRLPDWALPQRPAAAKPPAAPKEKAPPAAKGNALPANGKELYDRLAAWCVTLAPEKITSITEVMQYLKDVLGPEYGEDLDAWNEDAIRDAVKLSREFVEKKRAERQPAKKGA